MPLAQRFRRALLLCLLCSAAGFVFAAASANAQTPRLQGQSAAAAAMGNAFVAQADDPSALHYNCMGSKPCSEPR